MQSNCHGGKIFPVKLKTDGEYISEEEGRLLRERHRRTFCLASKGPKAQTSEHLSGPLALPAILRQRNTAVFPDRTGQSPLQPFIPLKPICFCLSGNKQMDRWQTI